MSISKSFHLRWNNHLTNLRTLLEYLYNEQYFVDVTLSCQDGLLRAHKLILSACSPYFDTIFRENPCKHPTVILKGITLRDMQAIIEYMYVGAVDIAEDGLSSLLEAANELHVKGLVQQPSEFDTKCETSEQTTFTTSEYTKRIIATAKNMQEQMINPDGSLSENCPVMTLNGFMKTEIKTETDNGISRPEMLIGNDEMTNEMFKVNQIKAESDNIDIEEVMMEEEEEGQNHTSYDQATIPQVQVNEDVYCKLCNRTFISKQNMKRHMQTHSGEKPHRCEYCNLSFLRLSHLQRHHRVHTGERPFGCSQCDKHFSRSDKLKQHVIQHHSNTVAVPKQQKQRGRPRKADNDALMKFYMKAPMIDTKNGHSGMGNADNDHEAASPPSLQALQQVYNIQTSISNSVSVVQ